MPLYTYECEKHGQFDVLKSMHDESNVYCSLCNKITKKIMTTFSINNNSKMGTNREELFDNLSREFDAPKDWRDTDMIYREAKGIPVEE